MLSQYYIGDNLFRDLEAMNILVLFSTALKAPGDTVSYNFLLHVEPASDEICNSPKMPNKINLLLTLHHHL
jgi:hypothetical protein